MKNLSVKMGVTISTPWLNLKEAAKFLDISEATFQRLQKIMYCPHGGTATCARYHAQVLTQWFKTVGESAGKMTNYE